MMKKLRHDERGNVLVTAILLMSVMLSVGIAVASTVGAMISSKLPVSRPSANQAAVSSGR